MFGFKFQVFNRVNPYTVFGSGSALLMQTKVRVHPLFASVIVERYGSVKLEDEGKVVLHTFVERFMKG